MPDLGTFRLSELVALGAALRGCGEDAGSLEETAGRIVRVLYDELRSAEERNCVLVRFYKTHPFGALDDRLQGFARGLGVEAALLDRTPCLTLLATVGDLPEWNDRHRSAGHQAVPLPSTEVVDRFPMISQLIAQFGLDAGTLVERDTDLMMQLDDKTYNVFYVPATLGSSHIPAQDFVRAYGVRSALGFGGVLPTGDLFAVVLFSRTPIPPETAELFKVLALSVKLATLPFAEGPVFTEDVVANRPLNTGQAGRSRLVALEQLLEVHERTVEQQARHLEELHGRERRRSQQLHALAEVGAAVGSMGSVASILDHVTEQAREIIGSHQAVASLTTGQSWAQAITSVSMSQRYDRWKDYDEPPDGSGIYALVCESNRPMRLTQAELEVHPRWRGFGLNAAQHPPMRGWLAVPLVGRSGENLGLVQLSDAVSGEFTAEDEAVLSQLAHLASVSIENARGYAREHDIATSLQQSLLPQVQEVPGLVVASRYFPAQQDLGLGGDWYDVFGLPDGRAVLVVGDVVGHDLRAARTMGQLRHAIRAYAVDDPDPVRVVSALDRLVERVAPEEFATLLYLLLDPRTGHVSGVNAGHPPPLLLLPESLPRFWDLAESPPAGYLPPWPYERFEGVLPADATLLLFTDGLIERRSVSLQCGLERLAALAAAHSHSPERLLKILEAELLRQELEDDVAMLAVRRTG